MRKVLAGVAAMAALVVVVVILFPHIRVQAQPQPPGGRAVPEMALLRDAGSAIGVSVRDLSSDEIAAAKLPRPGGVLVEDVREGSAAARAGFQSGDIVVEFDGERVRSVREFTRLVQDTPAGRTVRTSVLRDGQSHTFDVTPEARSGVVIDTVPGIRREIERRIRALPRNLSFDLDFDMPRVILTSPGRLGATLLPLDAQLAEYFGVTEGVLVSSVEADTPAAQAGLRAGDVITAVNDRPVSTVNAVSSEIRGAEAGSTLALRVVREKAETTLRATLPERARPAPRRAPPV